MKIEIPPIDSLQITIPKVEAQLGQDRHNIVMSIILPYEVTSDLDNKKVWYCEMFLLNYKKLLMISTQLSDSISKVF